MELTMTNECYICIYSGSVLGDTHIMCSKPDLQMTGDQWGILNGWFYYPHIFDPIWKTKKCNNFKQK